jgi:hypothetical protein
MTAAEFGRLADARASNNRRGEPMKQPTDEERASMSRATNSKVEEMKGRIARMIQPLALPGSNGIITLALLELGIERHLRISSTCEKSAGALLDGVLKKVLDERTSAL